MFVGATKLRKWIVGPSPTMTNGRGPGRPGERHFKENDMANDKIKVYGTTWCPDCIRAKRVLTDKSVSFEWIDISNDEKARRYVEKVNNGSPGSR